MRGGLLRRRQGQSSVEYLGTYAWAFIGLLVTIGALSYFGVLDPSSYIQERCDSGTQISCADTYLGIDETSGQALFILVITNNYAKDILVNSVTITNIGDADIIMTPQGRVAGAGLALTLSHTFPAHKFTPKQKENVQYTINYERNGAGAVDHDILGTATVLVTDLGTAISYCGDGNRDPATEECEPADSAPNAAFCAGRACRSDCTCAPP